MILVCIKNEIAEVYDARGNKPSVLVTSPGSPDLYGQSRAASRQFRHPVQQTGVGNSVGGRLQIKLSFDASTLQLVVSLICATGLIPRSSGQPRSSYAKIYLLPDRRFVLYITARSTLRIRHVGVILIVNHFVVRNQKGERRHWPTQTSRDGTKPLSTAVLDGPS